MPKCVVTKCPHQTGKKARYPEIVLHPFPKDIQLIQDWLRLAGMEEENLELVSFEILEDRRSDKFRMCSAHFTQDSYISKGTKRVLKADAKPSKFPHKTQLDFAQPPMMHRIAKRARIEQSRARSGLTIKAECSCKCHKRLKSRLVNASTQTEPEFENVSPTLVQPHLGQQHTTEDDTKVTRMGLAFPTTSIKHWETAELQIKQEEPPNGFPNFEHERFNVNGSSQDKPMVTSEGSFSIVTVDSWEAIHVQTEKDNTQNSLLQSEDLSEKEVPEGVLLHNRNHLVTAIKEEGNENDDLHPEQTSTNTDNSQLEKPITSMLSAGQKPIESQKGNTVLISKEDPCNENGRPPHQGSPANIPAKPEKRRKTIGESDLSERPKPAEPKCSKSSLAEEAASWSMEEKYAKEKKYVVYESCLDVLLLNMRCQQHHCSENIRDFDKQTMGSLLVVFGTCCQGHRTKLWESQPRVDGIGAGNVLLAALLVLTGSSFRKVKELCVALQMFSESSIHRCDNAYILPRINQWMKEEEELELTSEVDRGRTV